MNKLRWTIWFGSIAGLLVCSIFLSDLFAITGMSAKCIMLFVLFSIATEPILRYSSIAVDSIRKYYQRFKEKRGFKKTL